jgi:hypothetical protein
VSTSDSAVADEAAADAAASRHLLAELLSVTRGAVDAAEVESGPCVVTPIR